MRTTAWAIGGLLLGGCFTDAGGTAGSASMNGSSEGSSSSGTSVAPTEATATVTGSSTDATSVAPTGTTTGDTSAEDGSASSSTTGGGEGAACDPWAPMCAEGLKCAAYASDGGDAWDATKCTQVTGNDTPGAGCLVEESATSGIDSCVPGAMCWDVGQNLTGTCYALCTGTPEAPVCPPGSTCFVTNEGSVNVCVIDCDPLEDDCATGHVCVPDANLQFICLPPGGDLPVGSQCEFTNACAPGLVCESSTLMPSTCPDTKLGCCLQYCNTDKADCPDPLTCEPFFAVGKAPPGLEMLGLCAETP